MTQHNNCRLKGGVTAARILAIMALMTFMVFNVQPAQAVHDDGQFELGPDGGVTDILGSAAIPGPDWADIFNANGAVINLFGGAAATFGFDDNSLKGSNDRTIFAGSNKNNDLIGTWEWDTGNAPAKDDIFNAYVYAKIVNGDLIIYGGVERIDQAGDSHVDIEFNQASITLDEAVPCDAGPCQFIGEKQENDIIVSMDFVKGGGLGEVTVRRWNGTEFVLIAGADLGGEGCNAANGLPADTVCAFNNAAPINGGPWVNIDKSGGEITDIATNGFSEFGLNVTDLLGFTPCFGTVNFKTRTSQSFTAELKDFSLHEFEECQAPVTTEIHNESHTKLADDQGFTSSVPVFSVIHDQATVVGIVGFPPTGDVEFQLFDNASCSGTPVIHDTVTLPAGSDSTKVVESTDLQLTSAGEVAFKARYLGDSTYPESLSGCEPLTVLTVGATVNTQVLLAGTSTDITNTAVDLGTSVQDKAIVLGTGTIDPTGDVTFRRFTNADCSGTFVDETVALADDSNDDGMATALSSAFTADAAAFHCWQVLYSGDDIYSPSASTVGEPICAFDFDPPLGGGAE